MRHPRCHFNWRVLLLFTALGPPLGAAAWFTADAFARPQPLEAGEAGGFLLGFMLLAVPYSWLFGLVPALLTGLLAPFVWQLEALTHRAPRLSRAALGAALGAGTTFLFKWLVFGGEDLGGALSLEGVGAVSGAACSALVRQSWVSPNKSFKPKPLRGSA